MDDTLVDAFLHQVIIGGKVNGTFTSKAYDDIMKELVKKFHMEINKDKVMKCLLKARKDDWQKMMNLGM